jgi:hypothetical protein
MIRFRIFLVSCLVLAVCSAAAQSTNTSDTGSDFDGVSGATPAGIDSAADLPKITQALLDRGYSPNDIKKIPGGNILRVFHQVEAISREMQAESH